MAREHLRDFRRLARERLSEPLRSGEPLDADRLHQTVTELCRVAQAGGSSSLPMRDVAGVLFDLGLHLQAARVGRKP